MADYEKAKADLLEFHKEQLKNFEKEYRVKKYPTSVDDIKMRGYYFTENGYILHYSDTSIIKMSSKSTAEQILYNHISKHSKARSVAI